jgi:hypothetical protein
MDIQRCRDCVIDGVKEFAKLAVAMAPVTFADDCACLHIQSGEQGRRAVAFVIVAAAAVPELQAVPEPATLWLSAGAAITLLVWKRTSARPGGRKL